MGKKDKRKAAEDADATPSKEQQQQPAAGAGDKQKKRQKGDATQQPNGDAGAGAAVNPHPNGRRYTVSLAVPGSMLDDADSLEVATFLAAQVARAAALFCVDELVILDDTLQRKDGTIGAGAAFLARLCQYLETPPYLRKALVPQHEELRLAEHLAPLDAPHHLRANEWQPFREGVVLKAEEGVGSFVDAGLDRTALVEGPLLRVGARVTLRMGDAPNVKFMGGYGESMLLAEAVPPGTPREEAGLYWGFSTRLARGLAGLLRDCPFGADGYDLKLAVTERGEPVLPGNLELPRFSHMLVAVGGAGGLEAALERDKRIQKQQLTDLFDLCLDTCATAAPGGGGTAARAEEAALVSMGFLQTAIARFAER